MIDELHFILRQTTTHAITYPKFCSLDEVGGVGAEPPQTYNNHKSSVADFAV